MSKSFTVYAMRTQFISRQIEANSLEQAEQLAYETPPQSWAVCGYGDFEHYQTKEDKQCRLNTM